MTEPVQAKHLLLDARRRAGLTQQELARLAATSQSAIAAYESGARQPTLPVLQRLIEAAGFSVSLDISPTRTLFRLADLATLIRDQPDENVRLRLFFEFLRGADEAGDNLILLISAAPPTTGDLRYDALLAAAAEHLSTHAGIPTPSWALNPDRAFDGFWWVSDLPSARAQALVHSPASYRRRGVLIDRRDLEAA
jgi:transcriptional regulator with XRE-family HTH domain